MDHLVGIDSPTGPAHAVSAGSTEALCGSEVTRLDLTFPGGASQVCRACLRAAAVRDTSVPLPPLGRPKRPGGM